MEAIPTTDANTTLPNEVVDLDEALARLELNKERYKQLAKDLAIRVNLILLNLSTYSCGEERRLLKFPSSGGIRRRRGVVAF